MGHNTLTPILQFLIHRTYFRVVGTDFTVISTKLYAMYGHAPKKLF